MKQSHERTLALPDLWIDAGSPHPTDRGSKMAYALRSGPSLLCLAPTQKFFCVRGYYWVLAMSIPPRAREALRQIFTEEQLLLIEAQYPAAEVVLSQMQEGEEVKVGADIVVRKEGGNYYLVGPTRKRQLLYDQALFFVAYGLLKGLIPPEKYGLHREGLFLVR